MSNNLYHVVNMNNLPYPMVSSRTLETNFGQQHPMSATTLNFGHYAAPQSSSQKNQQQSLLSLSTVQIIKPNLETEETNKIIQQLNETVSKIKSQDNKQIKDYNFKLELETITRIFEEKKAESEAKEVLAWKSIELSSQTRNRSKSNSSNANTNPNLLIDLNFDDDSTTSDKKESIKHETNTSVTSPINIKCEVPANTSVVNVATSPTTSTTQNPFIIERTSFQMPTLNSKSPPYGSPVDKTINATIPTPTSRNEQLYLQMIEMGINPEIVEIGMEVIGTDNEIKLIDYLTDFQKLEEEKFPRELIKQGLYINNNDYIKSLEFLKECDRLMKKNSYLTQAKLMDALNYFNNDLSQASAYLVAHHSLTAEYGFADDIRLKEALLLHNNDIQKSLQYLLESPNVQK